MAQNNTPVKALVLAGGGARGSYQVGVWRALTELGWRPQIITGTSVGSLNGAMFALDLYETARDMWLTIRSQDVMELPAEDAPLSELHAFLKDAVTQGGMDVTPLEEIVERVLDEEKLRKSPIRLGLVTVEQKTLKARELPLEDIPEGKVKDYLLASAACFPALRAHTIDGVSYLDGGYRDNMPTALAQKMGAEELVCVDLEGVGITRPNRTGLPPPSSEATGSWATSSASSPPPPGGTSSWATTIHCGPSGGCGAAPTLWTAGLRAARMPPHSMRPSRPSRRTCGKSTPPP